MTKYRIRLPNGRVIGPFEKKQLFELKAKGHIKGAEEAQVFPTGNWGPITGLDFYAELIDDNRTAAAPASPVKEETFVIDLAKLRLQKNEKELEDFDQTSVPPVEVLTETVRLESRPTASAPAPAPEAAPPVEEIPLPLLELELEDQPHSSAEPGATAVTVSQVSVPTKKEEEEDIEEEEESAHDKTAINPIAQQEIEKMRRLQQEVLAQQEAAAAAQKKEAEDAAKLALILAKENAPADPNDSTQVIRIDKTELLETASETEQEIEEHLKKIQKRREKEEAAARKEEEDEEEEEIDEQKAKKKKLIILAAAMAIAYAVFFPEEKPKKPPFKAVEPQIVFPIPYDRADNKKSKVEFAKGFELFNNGRYVDIIKAGMSFKAAYENNLDNYDALNFLVRTYGEQLKYSAKPLVDAHTVFNLIQAKKPYLLADKNGVIGLNLFYMAIKKPDAAIDVVQKYLKLNSKDVSEDLFAVYVQSLIKHGKLDLAKQFYTALLKAPNKNRYTYRALIDYYLLNQESDKAAELADEAVKKFPKIAGFHLLKAEILLRNGQVDPAIPFIKKANALNLDYNNIDRAKYLELKGLVYASKQKPEDATKYLTESLKLNDSNDLRLKLATLQTTEGKMAATDKLINESLAVKHLIQAKDFYDKRNYELALSTAAKASDAFPGHIPSELFLAKVQLKLGLASQGLKTLKDLVAKYPNDKTANLALVEAYIETYKFYDAKNQIQKIASSEYRDTWEYASVNGRLQLRMGDDLQALSWLKNSMSMNPLNDEDIFVVAEILLRKANFKQAKLLLNQCIELNPVNPDYRIAYARMIYETQDDRAAIGYLLSLLDEFGENPKVMSEIAIFYYRSGKVKDFQDYKAKLEKMHSTDKALYEFLIKAALLDERYMEIPGHVEKLLVLEPGDLESMMIAGRVLFEQGKLVDAAKWFKRVQEKLPSYPKVLYYIAKIDFLSGDLDGAMKKIQENIKNNGENDDDLVFMAQIHQAKEELVESENLYKRAQKLNPRSYDAIVGLADLSTMRNNHDLSLDLYKRATKLRQEEPLIHKKIGDVYRKLGQGALAIEAYKLYLEMDPDSPHKSNLEAYINLMK